MSNVTHDVMGMAGLPVPDVNQSRAVKEKGGMFEDEARPISGSMLQTRVSLL